MNETSHRHEIMQDQRFWTKLAFTACALLREGEDQTLRGLWVDDFKPEHVADTKHGVDIEGTAWIGDGPQAMHPYRFILSVPQKILHRRRDRFSFEIFVLDQDQHTLQVSIGNEKHLPPA